MKCYRLKTNHNVIKHKVRFVNLSLNSMNILVNILVSFSPSNKILHIFELPTEWAFQITYESNFKELRELRNSQKQSGHSLLSHPVVIIYEWLSVFWEKKRFENPKLGC